MSSEALVPQEKAPEYSLNKSEKNYGGPIVCIYRRNSFLDKYVPQLQDIVSKSNGEFEMIAIPDTASLTDIDAWYAEHGAMLAGKRVITDWTCARPTEGAKESSNALDPMLEKVLAGTLLSSAPGLADFDSEMVARSTSEAAVEQYELYWRNLLLGLLKQADEQGRTPENLLFISDKIGDHYPLPSDVSDKVGTYGIERDNAAAARVQRVLETLGIGLDKIRVISMDDAMQMQSINWEGETHELLLPISSDKDWILVDRHALHVGGREETKGEILAGYIEHNDRYRDGVSSGRMTAEEFHEMERLYRCSVVLRFPPGNMMQDAKKLGLLDFSEEKIAKALEQILTKPFQA